MLTAWEAAHGHDVRTKCYPEYGCLVIEPALRRIVDSLAETVDQYRDQLAAIHRLRDQWATNTNVAEWDPLVELTAVLETDPVDGPEIVIPHVLTVEGPLAYPGAKDGFYRAYCSCKRYYSDFCATAQSAVNAGAQHVDAVTPIARIMAILNRDRGPNWPLDERAAYEASGHLSHSKQQQTLTRYRAQKIAALVLHDAATYLHDDASVAQLNALADRYKEDPYERGH